MSIFGNDNDSPSTPQKQVQPGSLELKIKEDSPYDLLYHNHVIEQSHQLSKEKIHQMKLPWYLMKDGLD